MAKKIQTVRRAKSKILSPDDPLIQAYSSSAGYRDTDFSNIGGSGISGFPGLTMNDYEQWRPEEKTLFSNVKDTILECEKVYKKHGLIKTVIDIMGDFACQGIRLVHPNKRTEKFYRNWWAKVSGEERSERFLNGLFKLGNVVIRMQTAKINAKYLKKMYSANAADIQIVEDEVTKNEIPWKYTFLHPATVEMVGGPLANFSVRPQYSVLLPSNVKRVILSPKNKAEEQIVRDLPDELIQAAKNNEAILLPEDKTWVYHYKKDDWESWSAPMVASTLLDISLYEKLKLADRAALDGAISNIRIFKLGSLDHKIAAQPAAMNKLSEILESNTQTGVINLVWDSAIDLLESKTDVHHFLGQEKYEPTLMAIYAGLGIPPTLTGTFGASGTTNNYISLKTLTQRLEYGRRILIEFWNEQIKLVQTAMGFRLPATVEFDRSNLGDEAAEKALLIQMSDRNLISDELMQRYFGHDPEMETLRINREFEERDSNQRAPKAGSFYNPQFEDELKKMALQTGLLSTTEIGLEDVPNRRADLPKEAAKKPGAAPVKKPKGQIGQGRPINKKDSKKRKKKVFKPKTRAKIEAWADSAQSTIGEKMAPFFLAKYNKKNFRALSTAEFEESENIKFSVLCSLEPGIEVTHDAIVNALGQDTKAYVWSTLTTWTEELKKVMNRPITVEERKSLQSSIYVLHKEEEKNGQDNDRN